MSDKKPSKKPTIKEIAEAIGLSEKTLGRYKAEGCDIYDPAELELHIASKRSTPTGNESAEMQAARIRLINIQIERHEHFLAVAKGKHMPREEVIRNVVAFGSKLRAVIFTLENDAANWAGQDAVGLSLKAREFTKRYLAEMYAFCSWVGLHKLPTPESQAEALNQAALLASLVPPEGFEPSSEATKAKVREMGATGVLG